MRNCTNTFNTKLGKTEG